MPPFRIWWYMIYVMLHSITDDMDIFGLLWTPGEIITKWSGDQNSETTTTHLMTRDNHDTFNQCKTIKTTSFICASRLIIYLCEYWLAFTCLCSDSILCVLSRQQYVCLEIWGQIFSRPSNNVILLKEQSRYFRHSLLSVCCDIEETMFKIKVVDQLKGNYIWVNFRLTKMVWPFTFYDITMRFKIR